MELHHSDEALVERLFKGADAVINLIDTSPVGKFIAGQQNAYYLAIKCGCNVLLSVGEDAPDRSTVCSDSAQTASMSGRFRVLILLN